MEPCPAVQVASSDRNVIVEIEARVILWIGCGECFPNFKGCIHTERILMNPLDARRVQHIIENLRTIKCPPYISTDIWYLPVSIPRIKLFTDPLLVEAFRNLFPSGHTGDNILKQLAQGPMALSQCRNLDLIGRSLHLWENSDIYHRHWSHEEKKVKVIDLFDNSVEWYQAMDDKGVFPTNLYFHNGYNNPRAHSSATLLDTQKLAEHLIIKHNLDPKKVKIQKNWMPLDLICYPKNWPN